MTGKLVPFLPVPTVEKDGERFWLDHERPQSIGKMRPWYGATPNLVRAYAWIMSLGAEGLREVAEIAVLNNNYLLQRGAQDPRRVGPVRRGRATRGAGALQLEAAVPTTPTSTSTSWGCA